MAMAKREAARLSIARQVAINEGRVWDRLDPKMQAQYMTLASNLIATVERMMVHFKWETK